MREGCGEEWEVEEELVKLGSGRGFWVIESCGHNCGSEQAQGACLVEWLLPAPLGHPVSHA